MKLPDEDATPGALVKYSRYVMSRLQIVPEARDLVRDVKPHHDAVKKAQHRINESDDALIDAQTAVDEVFYLSNEAMSEIQLDATSFVKRDYDSPFYRSLLPQGLAEVRAMPPGERRTDHTRLLSILAELPEDHPLHKHVAPMTQIDQAFVAPMKALELAELESAKAESSLGAASDGWFDALDGLAGSLRKIYPRRPARVDSFFPVQRKKAKSRRVKSSIPAATPAPTPSTPPTPVDA